MNDARREAHRIWTAPLLIAAATLVSLFGALLADGFWDGLAALLLFVVLAYAVTLGLRRHERQHEGR